MTFVRAAKRLKALFKALRNAVLRAMTTRR